MNCIVLTTHAVYNAVIAGEKVRNISTQASKKPRSQVAHRSQVAQRSQVAYWPNSLFMPACHCPFQFTPCSAETANAIALDSVHSYTPLINPLFNPTVFSYHSMCL
jgi:hypothetical protein